LETVAVIAGSRDRKRRRIVCNFGHNVGKVATSKAGDIALVGGRTVNVILVDVVLGERNKGMNGMNSPTVDHNSRDFRFGNKGSSMAQSCRTA
jgi:hypothetical protein